MSRKAEREAWTERITGRHEPAPSKFRNERAGKYASKHEADIATRLNALASCGTIWNLQEQKHIELVPGDSQERGVTYIADFVFDDMSGHHVLDAKGVKTQVYKIKKRLAWLLHKIKIEEV